MKVFRHTFHAANVENLFYHPLGVLLRLLRVNVNDWLVIGVSTAYIQRVSKAGIDRKTTCNHCRQYIGLPGLRRTAYKRNVAPVGKVSVRYPYDRFQRR